VHPSAERSTRPATRTRSTSVGPRARRAPTAVGTDALSPLPSRPDRPARLHLFRKARRRLRQCDCDQQYSGEVYIAATRTRRRCRIGDRRTTTRKRRGVDPSSRVSMPRWPLCASRRSTADPERTSPMPVASPTPRPTSPRDVDGCRFRHHRRRIRAVDTRRSERRLHCVDDFRPRRRNANPQPSRSCRSPMRCPARCRPRRRPR